MRRASRWTDEDILGDKIHITETHTDLIQARFEVQKSYAKARAAAPKA